MRRSILLVLLISVATALESAQPAPAAGNSLGLPPLPHDETGMAAQARVRLGHKLFMDTRLSHNDTMSCAMCHVPEQGFTSNEMRTAIGFAGRSLRRNAPTLLNVAYVQHLFHDGREFSLENQIWGPLLSADEMGNPSMGYVIQRIQSLPDYQGLFQAAFAGHGPSADTMGQAIASYERTLLAGDSRFDRWRYGHDQHALSAQEMAGFRLFAGKAGCVACHTIGEDSALFSDERFHDTGIGWASSMHAADPAREVQLAPGVSVTISDSLLQSVSEPPQSDVGRYEVTLDPADRWAYRTPTLRNVALTAPYMHDGSIATLAEVVEFYDHGGIDNPLKDPLVHPLHLTAGEKASLVAFLQSLTGQDVAALVEQARGKAER